MVEEKIGSIYKIEGECGLVYYGSTTWALEKRMWKHEYDFKCFFDGKRGYTTSFEVISRGNYNIYLVEGDIPESQFVTRESHYIRNYDCVNIIIPDRTDKEYERDNFTKRQKQKKKYQEVHSEHIAKWMKMYDGIQVNCPSCNMLMNRSSLLRHRKRKHPETLS